MWHEREYYPTPPITPTVSNSVFDEGTQSSGICDRRGETGSGCNVHPSEEDGMFYFEQFCKGSCYGCHFGKFNKDQRRYECLWMKENGLVRSKS